ncbi:MAG: proline dehydrogenase family protein [Deltaproteobacteria bacterium]|nr:proline dehydrogenase family protein [Deltaproteobacteria bacterium]MBZ0219673.1 proline dehydrogenase family protein [Deltaproteobacteria bacterium]
MKDFLLIFARRYIAGTERRDAIYAAAALNALGLKATIDSLGENVKTIGEAERSAEEYLALLADIKKSGVDSHVSLKLTHMGLGLSTDIAWKNTERVVKKAAELGNFVRIDMEGSAFTQATIDIFLGLREKYPNVGVAIQSALKRSVEDARRISAAGGSIRLVKGAYKEPPSIAFADKKDVDKSFELIMKELLMTPTRPAIATHDEKLIEEAKRFAEEKGIPKGSFDFEMLLGIKRTLQKRLSGEGYTMRVYLPYGRDWLPYMLRRLRERKENVWFMLKNILD